MRRALFTVLSLLALAVAAMLMLLSPALAAPPAIPSPGAAVALARTQLGRLPSHLAPVMSRNAVPNVTSTTNKTWNDCTVETATDTVANLQLVFWNGYVDGPASGSTFAELAPAGTVTRTASITYPLGGTPKQITFNGGATSTTDATGTLVRSDLVPLGFTIPRGGQALVCNWGSGSANSFIGLQAMKSLPGDTFNLGPSVADMTMAATGRSAAGAGTYRAPPVAILGTTTRATVLILGNSRERGVGVAPNPAANGAGSPLGQGGIEMALNAAGIGFINASTGGDSAFSFVNQPHAIRTQLAQWTNGVIGYNPINDVDARNQTDANTVANLGTFAGYFAAGCLGGTKCPVWFNTAVPYNTATAVAVSGITQSGGVATATVSAAAAASLYPGELVSISGAGQAAYNGVQRITTVSAANTSFTFLVPSGTATPATGTITYTDPNNPAQNVVRASEAKRVSVNGTIRAGTIAGQTGYIDFDQLLDPQATGLVADAWTFDGLHENLAGALRERNSGAVPVGAFQ